MSKKKLASMMEWIRPPGMGLAFFFAYYFANEAISRFHFMGPFAVMFMSGTNGINLEVTTFPLSKKMMSFSMCK